ncbi:MAG: twin transmembrane helix small protein [Proteobacteria bacterium]|nr:twin transmembrane helix small protein [Pseudomonadota bacterium]
MTLSSLISVLLGVALAAVLGVLAFGLLTLMRAGRGNARRSNRLMRWRVALQALAVVLFLLLLLAS